MDHIATTADYRVTPQSVAISLNVLGEANRVQCSVANGASIKCFIDGVEGLGYDSNRQYREWPLVVSPTFFNSDTLKYVYVAIPKASTLGLAAMIVFPSEQLDIYGQNNQNEQVGPNTYFYIWLQGIISAVTTTDDVDERVWTQQIDFGLLGTEQYRASKAITNIKVNGTNVQIENNTAEITTPQHMSQLDNDENFIEESDITAGNGTMTFRNKSLNLLHNHDWGDIKNKPNLVEGITIGGGKLTFLLSNGDTAVADFSSLVTAVNNLAASLSETAEQVDSLTEHRGMVIDPYVWASTYDPDGETWEEGEIGEYWFDTTAGKLKIFKGEYVSSAPYFHIVLGMFLLWHEDTGELLLYSLYNSLQTPTMITIFTQ